MVKPVVGVYSPSSLQTNSMFLAAKFLSTVIEMPGTFSVSAGRSKDGSKGAVLYCVVLATTLLISSVS